MRTTLTVLCLIGMPFLFQFCCNFDQCGCTDPPEEYYIDVNQINVNHNVNSNRENQSSIPFDDYYGIKISLNPGFLSQSMDYLPLESSGFSGVLLACDQEATFNKGSLNEHISNVKLFTLHDYDSLHLKGSEISDLITVDKYRYFDDRRNWFWETPGNISMSEFLSMQDTIRIYGDLGISFTKIPELDSIMEFAVEVEIESPSGIETYYDTTEIGIKVY